jgi:hypothetical protein
VHGSKAQSEPNTLRHVGVHTHCSLLLLLLRHADTFGPRFGIGLCLGFTAPAVFMIGLSTNTLGFILSRLFIGFSRAVFVACQFWCTSMFNGKVVGAANALAAGWVRLIEWTRLCYCYAAGSSVPVLCVPTCAALPPLQKGPQLGCRRRADFVCNVHPMCVCCRAMLVVAVPPS